MMRGQSSREEFIMTKTTINNNGTISVNYGHKSIIVPAEVWEKIKDHVNFLSWGELSALVAHATRGLDIYSGKDNGNANPNADRNWGRHR